MNRVDALCFVNRVMMEAFSRRTVESLKGQALFRLALPPFRTFLDINVGKEVEKDRAVIVLAGEIYQSGTKPESSHVDGLLQKARMIDNHFLCKTAVFPIDIRIEYRDIERYRQQRIEMLLQASYHIFAPWQELRSYRAAVQQLYSQAQFRSLLQNILRLYAMETRMLSRSVRIPRLIIPAREAITQTVLHVMEQEAEALATSLAEKVYRR